MYLSLRAIRLTGTGSAGVAEHGQRRRLQSLSFRGSCSRNPTPLHDTSYGKTITALAMVTYFWLFFTLKLPLLKGWLFLDQQPSWKGQYIVPMSFGVSNAFKVAHNIFSASPLTLGISSGNSTLRSSSRKVVHLLHLLLLNLTAQFYYWAPRYYYPTINGISSSREQLDIQANAIGYVTSKQ